MSIATAILTTAQIHLDNGDFDNAKKAIRYCLSQNKRPAIKLQAAKLVLDHERDLVKHETPEAEKTINMNVKITDATK